MRVFREKKGQFIVIAALLISIMIVSVSTIIYGTVTYYRSEQWEEYLTVVDSIRTASFNALGISLAKYSQTQNSTILRDNLNQWIRDVRKAYPSFGVDLSFTLESGVRSVFGMNLNYSLGLAHTWNQQVSFSAANTTFNLNFASVGLTGYNFSANAFLQMNIHDAIWYSRTGNQFLRIYVTVDKEGPQPIISLGRNNFVQVKMNDTPKNFSLTRYYSTTYHHFTYEIRVNSVTTLPSSVEVTLVDMRGIKTISSSTNITENSS